MILGQYDVRRVFGLGIHALILVEMYKLGVHFSIVQSLHNIYKKLKLFVHLQKGSVCEEVYVHKEFKERAITSPTLHSNSENDAQMGVSLSCIFKHIDVSLLGLANDLLNLS